MPDHSLNQETAQLLRSVVEQYRRSRRSHLNSRFYSVRSYLRRLSPSQESRDLEYTDLLVGESLSQAQVIDNITLAKYLGQISEPVRGIAAAATKTMAQRLKNRSDFLSTVGGFLTLLVSAITIFRTISPGASLAPLLIAFPFIILAQVERHMALEESVLLEELHELLK